ncbi:MAG: hypothetical protein ABI895_22825 [Deltaproteobacteria bacterium]
MGSVTDRGLGGSAGASAAAGGSGGVASNAGAAGSGLSGNEMGGSNGTATGGSNGSLGGVGQSGSAGQGGAGSAGSAGAAPADAGAPDSGAAAVSYTNDLQPILVARCSPCHATDNDGGHNAASSYADAVRVSARIVREIGTGGMPESGSGNAGCNGGDPGDPGCVSAAEFALIQRWVATGTPE